MWCLLRHGQNLAKFPPYLVKITDFWFSLCPRIGISEIWIFWNFEKMFFWNFVIWENQYFWTRPQVARPASGSRGLIANYREFGGFWASWKMSLVSFFNENHVRSTLILTQEHWERVRAQIEKNVCSSIAFWGCFPDRFSGCSPFSHWGGCLCCTVEFPFGNLRSTLL